MLHVIDEGSSVVDASGSTGPGVIVVAEPSVHALLAESGAAWTVQERQASIAEMWSNLSGGLLDQRSRVLVFSDSLMADEPEDDTERSQTARAVVAMANAGAHVFVVVWRPDRRADWDSQIATAAATQGVDVGSLVVHPLSPDQGGHPFLDRMRAVLSGEIDFPSEFGPVASQPLARHEAPMPPAPEPPPLPAQPPAERLLPVDLSELSALGDLETEDVDERLGEPPAPEPPSLPAFAPAPPAGEPRVRTSMAPVDVMRAQPVAGTGYPADGSLELLEQPKRPGQVTITVTSSKGGSGKSTASALLAASIAKASADAGRPMSVCLIDLDTRDGQIASLIGKFMPTALNIRVQPVWDEECIRRNLVHADGLDVDALLAPIRPRTADTVGPDFYRIIVRSLQRMYDVIVIDTSVQYLEPLVADVAFGESDEILFVTTLASTSVQGMARALREITAPLDESGLGIPREKIGILVNQSVANVGMERDQVLAAGLGVPVVGVVPLATKDVLTATNLNRVYALLDHPLIGAAYNELARTCLPNNELAPWTPTAPVAQTPQVEPVAPPLDDEASEMYGGSDDEANRKRGLFRR